MTITLDPPPRSPPGRSTTPSLAAGSSPVPRRRPACSPAAVPNRSCRRPLPRRASPASWTAGRARRSSWPSPPRRPGGSGETLVRGQDVQPQLRVQQRDPDAHRDRRVGHAPRTARVDALGRVAGLPRNDTRDGLRLSGVRESTVPEAQWRSGTSSLDAVPPPATRLAVGVRVPASPGTPWNDRYRLTVDRKQATLDA